MVAEGNSLVAIWVQPQIFLPHEANELAANGSYGGPKMPQCFCADEADCHFDWHSDVTHDIDIDCGSNRSVPWFCCVTTFCRCFLPLLVSFHDPEETVQGLNLLEHVGRC